MKKKLFVGNLPYSMNEDELRDLFARYEPVHWTRIVRNPMTEQSRGFGFVLLEDENAAEAVQGMNGVVYGGRTLRVDEARERQESPRGFDRHSRFEQPAAVGLH